MLKNPDEDIHHQQKGTLEQSKTDELTEKGKSKVRTVREIIDSNILTIYSQYRPPLWIFLMTLSRE